MFGPDLIDKISKNPKLSPYLSQPDFMTKIQAIQANPNKISEHLNDPRIMNLFSSLLGLGAQGFPEGGEDMDMELPDFSAFAKDIPGKANGSAESAKPSAPAAKEPAAKKEESKIQEVTEEEATAMEVEDDEEKKKKQARAASDKEKEAANALYKEKKFEEALEKYAKALELDPTNVAVLSNRSGGCFGSGEPVHSQVG